MNCFLSISACSIFYILMASNSVLCKTQKLEKVAEVTEVSAAVSMKDTCETLPSTIQVTKEEYDDLGNVVRSCEGTIGVTKCEGSCNSQIQPSVVTPTGFLKYSRATCNRSLPPSECEEGSISLSAEVTCVACVYRTVCDKLKCQTCQSFKEECLTQRA